MFSATGSETTSAAAQKQCHREAWEMLTKEVESRRLSSLNSKYCFSEAGRNGPAKGQGWPPFFQQLPYYLPQFFKGVAMLGTVKAVSVFIQLLIEWQWWWQWRRRRWWWWWWCGDGQHLGTLQNLIYRRGPTLGSSASSLIMNTEEWTPPSPHSPPCLTWPCHREHYKGLRRRRCSFTK